MTEPVPLQVFGPDFDHHVGMLKAAKVTITTDVQVKPLPALPGGPGTVIAFGVKPDFVCDCILIREDGVRDVVRVSAALDHWLKGGAPTFTAADMLASFGLPVREITDQFDLDEVEYHLDQQRAVVGGVRFRES